MVSPMQSVVSSTSGDLMSVSERLEAVNLTLRNSRRTEQPSSDVAHLWMEAMDTETGQRSWARRDLLEEYWRLQGKIRGYH